jgi:hypothetical protein
MQQVSQHSIGYFTIPSCISINDSHIELTSHGYPLRQKVCAQIMQVLATLTALANGTPSVQNCDSCFLKTACRTYQCLTAYSHVGKIYYIRSHICRCRFFDWNFTARALTIWIRSTSQKHTLLITNKFSKHYCF